MAKFENFKRIDIKTGFICNNNCRFCVQADNKCTGNRSFHKIADDLEECKDSCNEVVFTGGEVTIRKDFFKLIKLAKELGYKTVQIQSNGRMFSSMNFCKKTILAGVDFIALSLHGYCEEQHDFLTESPNSFKQLLIGIKNLKSLGYYVVTNTVIVKTNYKDLPLIAKLLVKLDVDQSQFAFVHAMGNAWKNKEQLVPKIQDVMPYIKEALQIEINAGKKVTTEAIPYCMMQGYEDCISEKNIPETLVRGKKFQNTDDFNTDNKNFSKMKFIQCKKCKYDDICEGVWRDYGVIYGGKEFKPV